MSFFYKMHILYSCFHQLWLCPFSSCILSTRPGKTQLYWQALLCSWYWCAFTFPLYLGATGFILFWSQSDKAAQHNRLFISFLILLASYVLRASKFWSLSGWLSGNFLATLHCFIFFSLSLTSQEREVIFSFQVYYQPLFSIMFSHVLYTIAHFLASVFVMHFTSRKWLCSCFHLSQSFSVFHIYCFLA